MQDVTVRTSKINGKGVFAKRDFKKGEIVIRWDTSHPLTSDDAKNRKDKKFLTCVNNKYYLSQPPAKYVNHSCEANTFLKNFCDVAKRKIGKYEEITTDYGKDASIKEMHCACGSKKCRKIITGKS